MSSEVPNAAQLPRKPLSSKFQKAWASSLEAADFVLSDTKMALQVGSVIASITALVAVGDGNPIVEAGKVASAKGEVLELAGRAGGASGADFKTNRSL